MDRSLWIKLFNISLYLFIAGHLLLLTVYVLPHEKASNALTGFSDMYMSKLFHQQWDLFAPEPPNESLKLVAFVVDSETHTTDTIYPAHKSLERHLSCISVTATKEVYMNRRYAQYLLDVITKDTLYPLRSSMPWSESVSWYYLKPFVLDKKFIPTVSRNDSIFQDLYKWR